MTANRLSVPVAVLLVALAAACRPPVRGNGTNILLITLETTRADHVGAYGYARETTPHIDRLAAEGVLFERYSAVAPRTNPSLASLMTSRFPHEHGVRNLMLPLEPEFLTLAEVLWKAGYRSGAIQTHPRLVAPSGLAQGFDDYDDDYDSHRRAPEALEAGAEWIRRVARGERPWFLWVHLMDPHWTYDPPTEWPTRFARDPSGPRELYRSIAHKDSLFGPVIFRNEMSPEEVAAFVDLYDDEIRFTDEAIGKMLEALQALGLRDETLIVVSADHGESLGENDYFFEHGDLGSEPEIHIPLVISGPFVPRGLRVPATVQSLDLAPTLLDLVGLPPEESFRGSSLLPLIEGRDEDRICFGETGKPFHEENDRREVDGVRGKWRWARRGDFKLVHIPRASGEAERRLYDLSSDEAESRNVAEQHPEILAELGAELDAFLSEDTGEEREYHITPEAREQLRALGYVD